MYVLTSSFLADKIKAMEDLVRQSVRNMGREPPSRMIIFESEADGALRSCGTLSVDVAEMEELLDKYGSNQLMFHPALAFSAVRHLP